MPTVDVRQRIRLARELDSLIVQRMRLVTLAFECESELGARRLAKRTERVDQSITRVRSQLKESRSA